jgi:hypothetical protein
MNVPDDNSLTRIIIGLAMRVHTRLGPGLLESAYERCLCPEFDRNALTDARQDHFREIARRRCRAGRGQRQPLPDCSRSWRARASTLSSISLTVTGLTGASTHWPFSSTWRKIATRMPSLRSWRPRM